MIQRIQATKGQRKKDDPLISAEGGVTSLNYTRLNEDPDRPHIMVLDLAKGARRVLDIGAATGT